MNDQIFQILLTVLGSLLGGGVGAAVVKAVSESQQFKAKRKAEKEDKAEDRADETAQMKKHMEETDKRLQDMERKIDAAVDGLMVTLLDRIRYLGQSYISKGEIDFDDRRIFHMMHDIYHNGLGGNGDADLIVEAVDNLPLKK